jgi:membrane-bound serine protease (ClpP class)
MWRAGHGALDLAGPTCAEPIVLPAYYRWRRMHKPLSRQVRWLPARMLALVTLVFGMLLLWSGPTSSQSGSEAHLLEIDGAIGPAASDYVGRSFKRAAGGGAALLVVRMDTPGGLDTSMREIVRDILASPVPVVTYVSPSGARAASAGTFILYASHVAAMAPGTNAGAATPVQIGVGAPQPAPSGDNQTRNDSAPEGPTAADRKAINDAVAYIRSLAELRGRNADWGEAAVRTGESLSAQAALERKVIDLVARDMNDLLRQLDGRAVAVAGSRITLETGNLTLVEVRPNWRTRFLSVITNPNVALILMLLGIYGLLFEFMSPGAIYPGTIGVICLVLGMYALAVLPVNFAGIGLILLGLALIIAEHFAPTFGLLGLAGAIALALGATIMFDTEAPEFRIGWATAAGIAVASLGIIAVTARLAMSSRRARVVSGREQMIGATGTVIDWKDGRGHVFVHGERWRANGVDQLEAGETVEVRGIDGLILTVESAPTGGQTQAWTA